MGTATPLLSFVIPSYNRAHQVRKLVSDLLKEEGTDFEVVVVDDASSDETVDFLCDETDPRFRLLCHEKNLGMVKNWNFCAKTALGKWISIFHHDDSILPGIVKRLRSATSYIPEGGLICAPGLDGFSNDQIVDRNNSFPKRKIKLASGFKAGRFLFTYPFYCSSVVVAKQVYDVVGYFDESLSYSADEEFWPRVVATFPLYYFPEPTMIFHRHTGHEMMRTWLKPDFIESFLRTQREALQHFSFCKHQEQAILQNLSEKRLLQNWLTITFLSFQLGQDNETKRYLEQAKLTRGRKLPGLKEIVLRFLATLPRPTAVKITESISQALFHWFPELGRRLIKR